MKRLLKIVAVGIAVLIVAGVVVALTVNVDTFRPKLQSELSNALGRQVSIGKLSLSIFSGRVVADNLAIADDPSFSSNPFLSTKQVKISVALMPLIFSRTLQIKGLTITNPDINLLHTRNGVWNYSTIGNSKTAGNNPEQKSAAEKRTAQQKKAEDEGGSSKNMNLSVDALDITNGKVSIGVAHERAGMQNYQNVNVQVRNFSATSEFPVTVSAQLPGSGTFNLDGSAGPINQTDASLTPLKGKATISDLDLSRSTYIDRSSGMGGIVNIAANFSSDGQKLHSDAEIKADKLKAQKNGAPAGAPIAVKCSIVHDLKQQQGVIQNGVLDLGKASAHFAGNYKMEPTLQLALNLNGDNLPVDQLEPLLPAFGITFPDGSKLQGGTLSVNLKANGPVDHLVTTGSVKLAETTLAGFSLGGKLASVSQLTGLNSSANTEIKNLSSDLRIAPDGIQTSNMNLNVPSMGEVSGAGSISESNQLDYHMLAKLTGNGGGALGAITANTGNEIPFLVKGTTAKPVIQPDVKGMATNKIKSLINGGNNGSGSNSQLGNAVDSFKTLFGKK